MVSRMTSWRSLAPFLSALALSACGPAPEAGDELAEAPVLDRLTLGARYNPAQTSVTFRVYSARATRVELWLYAQPKGAAQLARINLTHNTTTHAWSTTQTVNTIRNTYGITGTIYYGYRAWGPNWTYSASWTPGSAVGFVSDVDAQGNRFNPNKLLFDPYARELSHDPVNPDNSDGTWFASGALHRLKDSGPWAPKGIVLAPDTTSTGTKPTRPLKDEIVYEVHVRGLTKSDTSIPAAYRGTYRGAGLKAPALAALGVTAIELLPLQETQNDANDVVPNSTTEDNYWGYMTLGYFAPDRRYSSDQTPGGPTRELKAMVAAFHAQGIKVYVDVVYNHTGEGGVWGADNQTMNVMSFRGLDNRTYYSLTSDYQWPWDNTGVGGNYNTFNTVAQDLIVDSLAYWRDTLGFDGFRFDLASVLGNTCEHGCFSFSTTNPANALNRITTELPARPAAGGAGTDFIAEPWAIGPGTYQVGAFPWGWAEWNGAYRDVVRKDQNQLGLEPITPGTLASRFAGSSDLYGDDGRKPYHSVNFVVAHDGFTLRDLYAYNGKNNLQPWPNGPSDGGEDNNHSWDQGNIAADQRKAARNGMALMLLSAGVPMMTGGDEFLRTQFGNNNVYNLDSSSNWLNYSWSTDQTNFRTYTQRLVAFRKAHPALRPAQFYSAVDNNGNVMEQLRWFTPAGVVPSNAYWADPNSHAIAWRIDGSELGDPASALYVAYNGWSGAVSFSLPWPGTGKTWYRVTDTCTWAEGANQVRSPGSEDLIGGEWTSYSVCGRGVLLLIAK
jgi:isoamylase